MTATFAAAPASVFATPTHTSPSAVVTFPTQGEGIVENQSHNSTERPLTRSHHTTNADREFDQIARKLTAGKLTLEYLVAYSIEAYSTKR